MTLPGGAGSPPDGVMATRPATSDDLLACERIWRDGINDYTRRLNQPDIPTDNPGLRRLHAHTLATDPALFRVAERGGEVVAFGSAVERGRLWFLSMLFVDPAAQAKGLGRRLLSEIWTRRSPFGGPPADGVVLATATDSAQPISNGLYGSLGILPRMPLFNLVGRPRPGWSAPPLPAGVTPVAAPAGAIDAGELAGLDLEVLGFDHPADHAFALAERPNRFAYRDAGGRLVGYGYTSPVGRLGPVAVQDAALMRPVVAHLLTAVEPRGASAIWVPGGTTGAMSLALEANLRIEDWPLLLGWSRPPADFERYLPISPGLL